MKIAILSDIDRNYTAFKAVLEDVKKHNVTLYIIAGEHNGKENITFTVTHDNFFNSTTIAL